MTARLPTIVVGLLLPAVTLALASRVLEARQSTATVSGVVFDDAAGKKAASDALVMIAGTDVGLVRVTGTDAAGRFTFTGLPPGRFLVAAGKPAYLSAMHGATGPGRPGSIVALKNGDVVKDLRLTLIRGAAISGRVVDEAGQPIAGARVRILPRRTVGTDVTLLGDAGEPSTVTTDDRGSYRVYDLPPGEYVVGVQPRGVAPGDTRILKGEDVDAASRPPLAAGAGAAVGYAPVFYPNASSPSKASALVVSGGDERTGVDVTMRLSRFARIDGTIGDMSRVPAQHQITLRPRGFDVAGTLLYAQNGRATPDGRFSFTNVPPGEYTILARTLAPPVPPAPGTLAPTPLAPWWAMADVTVAGDDLTNVPLTWLPGLSISGRVVFEGLPRPPADITVRVGIRPTPSSNNPTVPEPATIDGNGRFTLKGLVPGKYWLTAIVPASPITQQPDWFAATAEVAGRDAFDVAMELAPGGSPEVTLTLTDVVQQIDGTVRDARGQAVRDCPIVVFAVDQAFWFPQSRRIVTRRSDASGALLFGKTSALPPGEYYVAAAPGLAANEQFDPGVLRELIAHAERVTLAADDSKTVTLIIR